MPPRVKVTEDAILEAALRLTRKCGHAQLNARDLAKELGCSIQPIFRTFKSMENLRKALFERVAQVYEEHLKQGLSHAVRPSLGVGLAYIDFAKKERNLFKLLFMSEEFEVKSFFDLIRDEENQALVGYIAQSSGLDRERAEELFITVWLVTHGIASMIATNACDLSEPEVERILTNTFQGVTMQLKQQARPPEATKPQARSPEATKPQARSPEATKPQAEEPEVSRQDRPPEAASRAEEPEKPLEEKS